MQRVRNISLCVVSKLILSMIVLVEVMTQSSFMPGWTIFVRKPTKSEGQSYRIWETTSG